jgi:hypothetical protein
MMHRIVLVLMLLGVAGCSDERNANLEQEVKQLNTRLQTAEMETQKLRSELASQLKKNEKIIAEESAPKSSSSLPTATRRGSIVLLVDSNRVGSFGSLVECQRASSKVNEEAYREQQRIDELNRLEFEKDGPPGIIRGRAKTQKTQCLELSQ